MATKLYVGNLPYSFTDVDLSSLFAEVGTVRSAQVIIDRNTNQSRGFGFVEMSSQEEADKAIAQFHGKQSGGRSLVVNESRPRENSYSGGSRSGGGGRSNNYGGGRGSREDYSGSRY